MIEMQEDNSISDNCVNYDERINMCTTQALQLMPLRDSDLRIIDDL
jgi:hypothetical protein